VDLGIHLWTTEAYSLELEGSKGSLLYLPSVQEHQNGLDPTLLLQSSLDCTKPSLKQLLCSGASAVMAFQYLS